jgi:hypothetical protein
LASDGDRQGGLGYLLLITIFGPLLAGLGVVILSASEGPGLAWRQGLTHPGHLRLGLFVAGAGIAWFVAAGWFGALIGAVETAKDAPKSQLVIGMGRHGPWKRRPANKGRPFAIFIAMLGLFEAFAVLCSLWLTAVVWQLLRDDTWRRRTPPYGMPGPLLTVVLAVVAAGFTGSLCWLMVRGHSRWVEAGRQGPDEDDGRAS